MAEGIGAIGVKTPRGEEKTLGDYTGDVLLIVNVASQCGNTPQYAGLEELHRRYRGQGLRVLGFPSNDFGNQEPGTNEEIAQFCSTTYGVTFELFDKVHAKEPEQHPLYAYLTQQATPSGPVGWNFEKFVVGRSGTIVARFDSKIPPDDPALIASLEGALAQPAP
jgi:glutathione peroxidase